MSSCFNDEQKCKHFPLLDGTNHQSDTGTRGVFVVTDFMVTRLYSELVQKLQLRPPSQHEAQQHRQETLTGEHRRRSKVTELTLSVCGTLMVSVSSFIKTSSNSVFQS